MEERVKLFYTLHNNPWFHEFNHTLDVIKTSDPYQKKILIKHGSYFFKLFVERYPWDHACAF